MFRRARRAGEEGEALGIGTLQMQQGFAFLTGASGSANKKET